MITTSTLLEQTTTLSLSGFKQSLLMQSEDTKYQSLSFEERLFHLFESEINQRQDKRIKRMLTIANLKDKTASLEQIQYLPKRKLDKSLILSLANGDFINKNQNDLDISKYIIYYMFVQNLEKAFLLGLPKGYKSIDHHEMKLKGKIDINRFIKYDIPFKPFYKE